MKTCQQQVDSAQSKHRNTKYANDPAVKTVTQTICSIFDGAAGKAA
jgi:hypothetical protein